LDIIADEPELEDEPNEAGIQVLRDVPPVEIARAAVRATKASILDKARMRALLEAK
jgi:hypothetical protein